MIIVRRLTTILNMINYARTLIKHFVIWLLIKIAGNKYYCEPCQYRTSWYLQYEGKGIGSFQAQAVYNCFVIHMACMTNSLLYIFFH